MNSPRTSPPLRLLPILLLTLELVVARGFAAQPARNLGDMTIEQLMNESVTSVAKKETRLGDAPAAIAVITDAEILNLGITSIPEALRLAAGLDVARANGNTWAISSRGFNNVYANRLLVLQDGRTLYTPLFGGVYWDVQDMVLEDMKRIEVIRGPGASLWGANAVNGVINITSKSSGETQGSLVSTTYGTEQKPVATVRQGAELTPDLHFRVYAKLARHQALENDEGRSAADNSRAQQAGFRMDWDAPGGNALVLQGDSYAVTTHENVITPYLVPPFSTSVQGENPNRGSNLLGRWTHTVSDSSQFSLQAYLDHYRHGSRGSLEERETVDVEAQYRFPVGRRHDLVSGIGYRETADEVDDTPYFKLTPPAKTLRLATAFLQDEISVVPELVRVTLGAKVEHNDYTGTEVQPSMRVAWTTAPKQMLWGAVSRAVTNPTRVYRDSRIFSPAIPSGQGDLVIQPSIIGSPGTIAETLKAYELGYRAEVTSNLSFDASIFYNDYDHVTSFVPGAPYLEATPLPVHLVYPAYWSSVFSAESHGAELSVQWKPIAAWGLSANYTFLKLEMHPTQLGRSDPRHQASLHSHYSLPHDLKLSSAAYYVGGVEMLVDGTTVTPIPAYLRIDLGFTWSPSPRWEIGVFGQNLTDPRHTEALDFNTNVRTQVPRSYSGRVTLRF